MLHRLMALLTESLNKHYTCILKAVRYVLILNKLTSNFWWRSYCEVTGETVDSAVKFAFKIRHSQKYIFPSNIFVRTLPGLRGSYVVDPSRILLGRTEHARGQLDTYYTQCSQVKIQTPTHCNLIGCDMTLTPTVLSPSSILPPPSSNCAFVPARMNRARVFLIILLHQFI
jgi:hypothetical protein